MLSSLLHKCILTIAISWFSKVIYFVCSLAHLQFFPPLFWHPTLISPSLFLVFFSQCPFLWSIFHDVEWKPFATNTTVGSPSLCCTVFQKHSSPILHTFISGSSEGFVCNTCPKNAHSSTVSRSTSWMTISMVWALKSFSYSSLALICSSVVQWLACLDMNQQIWINVLVGAVCT